MRCEVEDQRNDFVRVVPRWIATGWLATVAAVSGQARARTMTATPSRMIARSSPPTGSVRRVRARCLRRAAPGTARPPGPCSPRAAAPQRGTSRSDQPFGGRTRDPNAVRVIAVLGVELEPSPIAPSIKSAFSGAQRVHVGFDRAQHLRRQVLRVAAEDRLAANHDDLHLTGDRGRGMHHMEEVLVAHRQRTCSLMARRSASLSRPASGEFCRRSSAWEVFSVINRRISGSGQARIRSHSSA